MDDALKTKVQSIETRWNNAVARADSYRNELLSIYKERFIFPETKRGMLASGYFKLVVQDHASIVILARHGCVTSAMKLYRSLFEALCDGLWTYRFADDLLVERLLNENNVELPSEKEIVTAFLRSGRGQHLFRYAPKRMEGHVQLYP